MSYGLSPLKRVAFLNKEVIEDRSKWRLKICGYMGRHLLALRGFSLFHSGLGMTVPDRVLTRTRLPSSRKRRLTLVGRLRVTHYIHVHVQSSRWPLRVNRLPYTYYSYRLVHSPHFLGEMNECMDASVLREQRGQDTHLVVGQMRLTRETSKAPG